MLFSASPASVGCWAVLKTRNNNNALSFMRLFDVVAVGSAQELKIRGSPGAVSPWCCPSIDSCEVECLWIKANTYFSVSRAITRCLRWMPQKQETWSPYCLYSHVEWIPSVYSVYPTAGRRCIRMLLAERQPLDNLWLWRSLFIGVCVCVCFIIILWNMFLRIL